jgi:hypothetical protein
MRMPPAMICQTSCGTPSRAVVALSNSVNATTETARDAAMTSGRYH